MLHVSSLLTILCLYFDTQFSVRVDSKDFAHVAFAFEFGTRLSAQVDRHKVKAKVAKFINDQDHVLAAVGGIRELIDYISIRHLS